MKIQFLGTGAAEGIPAMFCDCELCEYVREKKGREIRHRASVIINDELIIDLGPDVFSVSAELGMNLKCVNYILLTHSHLDHTDILSIVSSLFRYRKNSTQRETNLKIVCTEYVAIHIRAGIKRMGITEQEFCDEVQVMVVTPGEKINLGRYSVEVIPSNHDNKEQCVLYLISDGSKTLFYATDSKQYSPEKLLPQYKNKECIDIIISDCTFGKYTYPYGRHMGLEQNIKIKKEMEKCLMTTKEMRYFLTHITHNVKCSHNDLVKSAVPYGMEVAYDSQIVMI